MSNNKQEINPNITSNMLNEDIVPIKITLHHNLEKNKEPVDLTGNMFIFDSKIETEPFNTYPYLCTNRRLNKSALKILEHKKCAEVFFNIFVLKKYLQNTNKNPTPEEIQEIIEYNIDTMLRFLLPISFPVYKKIKYSSNEDDIMSFFEAIVHMAENYTLPKPANETTKLKIHGVDCTIDDGIVLDTIITNPAYRLSRLASENYVDKLLLPAITKWKSKYVEKLTQNSKEQNNANALIIAINKNLNPFNYKGLNNSIDNYRTKYSYNNDSKVFEKKK